MAIPPSTKLLGILAMHVMKKTGERVVVDKVKSTKEKIMFFSHLATYSFALKELKKNSTVLDVGCGEGYGSFLLSQKANAVVALDINQEAVEYAKRKYLKSNLDYRWYSGEKLPFLENSFDAIVCIHVIEHIADDLSFLNEMRRVIKKGGHLIMATPNRKIRLSENQKPWSKFHIREYSIKNLIDIANNYFKVNKALGMQAKKEIMYFEIKRLERIRVLIKYDFLKLRRILPYGLKNFLLNLFKKEGPPNISIEDFFFSDKDTDTSLDLIIIAEAI